MNNKYIEGSIVALNVLEAIRATNPELIADNMPDGWGMNKLRAALTTPQATERRHLCVDGHESPDSESSWSGDGQFPPFGVFNIDAQNHLLPYHLTRKQAEEAMHKLMENTPQTTEDKSSPVIIDQGRDEAEQEGSFMNATLQSVGEAVAMSISTSLIVPKHIAVDGQAAVAAYIQEVLSVAACNCEGLSFHVQVGPSRDAMVKQEDSEGAESARIERQQG